MKRLTERQKLKHSNIFIQENNPFETHVEMTCYRCYASINWFMYLQVKVLQMENWTIVISFFSFQAILHFGHNGLLSYHWQSEGKRHSELLSTLLLQSEPLSTKTLSSMVKLVSIMTTYHVPPNYYHKRGKKGFLF